MTAATACRTCGTELREGARFCYGCGAGEWRARRPALDFRVKRGSREPGHSRPNRGGHTPAPAGRRSTSYQTHSVNSRRSSSSASATSVDGSGSSRSRRPAERHWLEKWDA
jgi:hypothetical protein